MKCIHCGGEVSAEALSCPYCGNINEEGVRFQQEIQEKIKRNKLLAPLLLKQKTPELAEKLLERMILISVAVFFVGMGLLFAMAFMENGMGSDKDKVPLYPYAVELEKIHTEGYSSDYDDWSQYRDSILDKLETGERILDYDVEYLFRYASNVWNAYDQEDPYCIKGKEEIQAMFRGILGFTNEEMKWFTQYEGYWDIEDTDEEALYQLIRNRLEEVQR